VAPLSLRQVRALLASATRQLAWASLAVRREVRSWLEKANAIPDAPIRRDAVNALRRKRSHIDGAALFTILPSARSHGLLRLLVAYEIMCDFLDSASERGMSARVSKGRQMHLALVDAFDLKRSLSDYYLHHPWRQDGGYLDSLVAVCRQECAALPWYELVAPLVVREALRADVLAVNHHADPVQRDAGLREWAWREHPQRGELAWFELTGVASATLTTHALLALAAGSEPCEEEIARTYRQYCWINLATTMLDSYVDQLEDTANGDHSYVAHYPTRGTAVARLQKLVQRSLRGALELPDGERHAVIVACMVAMYLSKDSARSAELLKSSRRLANSGGSLTKLLLPILRMWRIAHAQRSC
jgi:tetraprenyl-beta-curcumene synthase